MRQIFTKNSTNSSGRAILRRGNGLANCALAVSPDCNTTRRPGAVPPTDSTFCRPGVSRKMKTVLRDDTSCSAVRRVPAFVLLLALCCVSCRNVIEAPDETAEIAESTGGEGTTGKLYTLSGAVGAGGAVPSSLAGNSRGAFFSDTGGGVWEIRFAERRTLLTAGRRPQTHGVLHICRLTAV